MSSTLHDEIFPQLALWQQNFLMLYGLRITYADAEGISVTDDNWKAWRLMYRGTIAAWRARYIGDTHPAPPNPPRFNIGQNIITATEDP